MNEFFFPAAAAEPQAPSVVFKNITENGAEAWNRDYICGGIVLLPLTDLKDDEATEADLVEMLKSINEEPM